MTRDRLLSLFAGCCLFLLALVAPSSAAAALPDPTPAEISALLGGTPEAKWITAGSYSPDGKRIVYAVLDRQWADPKTYGDEPWNNPMFRDHYNEIWVARADGSQSHRLLKAGYYNNSYRGQHWAENGMVGVGYSNYLGDSIEYYFGVTVGAAGDDTWRESRSGRVGRPDARRSVPRRLLRR